MTAVHVGGIELRLGCSDFLYREAAALDAHDYVAWLAMLTPDVSYRIPVRTVRPGGVDEHSATAFYLHETYDSLRARVERFATDYAWAEDPPSRTRHCISNVIVETDDLQSAEIAVRSNIVLLRYAAGQTLPDIVSGERRDVLRATHDGWRLARRLVLLDSSVLGMHNFSVFL